MDIDRGDISEDCRQVIAGVIAKGKRTKRRRPPSPFLGRIATSACSSSAGGAGDQDEGDATAAAATSIESTAISSTEEEEDMANCLILLAQGGGGKLPDASATVTNSGLYVYECKTCSRIFPSFQALGGHRASHKKPKLPPQPLMVEPATPALVVRDVNEEDGQLCKTALLASPAPLHFPSKAPTTQSIFANIARGGKQKVHECSICGLEFGSGQALGGHMRRHRTAPTVANQAAPTNPNVISDGRLSRNILPLDLNLPAPEDDRSIVSKFVFGSTQQQRILFSGPTLVDCHY